MSAYRSRPDTSRNSTQAAPWLCLQVQGLLFLPLCLSHAFRSGPPQRLPIHCPLLLKTLILISTSLFFSFSVCRSVSLCVTLERPEGPGPGKHVKVILILFSAQPQVGSPTVLIQGVCLHDICRFSFKKITETLALDIGEQHVV